MKKNLKNSKDLLKSTFKKPEILDKVKLPGNKPGRKPKKGRRQDVKLHQHLLERFRTKKEIRLRKKAEYLATLPKGRVKRILYRMHPKRVARFVFSRDGVMLGLKVAGVGLLLSFVAAFVTFAYFRKDLPKNITDLKACSQGQKTSYYDRTGEILLWRGEGDVDCRPVPLADMSEYLKEAVIATEDQAFYEHPGFDVRGLLSAAISNADGDGRGGSTITQQYVKLAVLNNNERRLSRKIKELILSIELERTYEKDEILQAYLNEVSFGSVYNGAESASQGFFNKPAKDLTLDEAAIFAAAIQAPGSYWEPENKEALVQRRNYVLEQMIGTGAITREEAEEATKVDTIAKVSTQRNKYKDIKAPHFVLEVQKRLEEEFGEKNIRSQGYKVITTLDMTKQGYAEAAVAEGIAKLEGLGFDNSALVSEEVATGQVVAYVGSRDFNYGDFGQKNIAGTPRSPGSSVKPYDYASLMKSSENWGAGSIMYDWVTQLPGWSVSQPLTNFGNNRGNGPSSIRYLLGNSKNIPAAKAVYIAGIPATHDLMKQMGVETGFVNCGSVPCDQVLSTALGDGGEIRLDEHVNGYATFSRLGKRIPQQFVLKILDSKGKVIRDNTKEPVGEQALDPQIAYIIADILSDGNASFFRSSNRSAQQLNGYRDNVIPTAIKTGTTNNAENGWMMGFTPEFATGVWIGHHENKSTAGERMEELSGPIWGGYMRRIYEERAVPERWAQPEGIKTVAHNSDFYKIVKGACSGSRSCNYGQSDIYPSWYTVKKSSNAQTKVVIDTVSGKRATDCTPARARKEITGGGIIVPELDSSDPYYKQFMDPVRARLKSATGEAIPAENEIDDVHSCSDTKPSVTISMPNTCNGSCTITASVTAGTKTPRNLYFKMDGAVMAGGSYDISGGGTYSFDLVPQSSGAHEFSVEVVDDGLYDASASKSSTLTSVPFNFDSANSAGLNVKLTWDDVGGTYTLNSSGGGNGMSLGCTPSGSKCTANVPKLTLGAPGSYTLSIESSSPDRTSNSLTYTY